MSIIDRAEAVLLRKNPGISRVLIGSTKRRMPFSANLPAANFRLVTIVIFKSSKSTPTGTIPAKQLTCLQPNA